MNPVDETLAALDARIGPVRARALARVFGPPKPAPVTKGDLTTQAAKEIIEAEKTARDSTTARLRAQRLARDEKAAAEAPKKPAAKRRAR